MSPTSQTAHASTVDNHADGSNMSLKSHHPWILTTNLYREAERLKTFEQWNVPFLRPEDLAADGFYYTGMRDIVRCAFCGVEVGQWVDGDDVHSDHLRWSADCDFVRGLPCNNIPSSESSDDHPSPSSSPPSYDECGPYGHMIRPFSGPERACNGLPANLLQDLEHLGVSRTSGPVCPRYSTEAARLASFAGWPSDCPVTGPALAEAGFYYTGKDDHSVCFHCGGGLKDWEAGDNPWVEHARWFSRCAFVLMHKGRDFVMKVAKQMPAILSAEAMEELLEHQITERSDDACFTGSGPSECEKQGAEEKKPSLAESPPSPPDSEKNLRDMELCKICYSRERAIVFLPCGHFVSCAMCASALSNCPVCRKPFEATVRAFLS